MAKKKVNKIEEKAVVKTEKPASYSYSGAIKVTVKKNNTVVKTKNYTNNGSTQLFKFMCLCLKGDYTTAKNYQPTRIKLFERTDGKTPSQVRNSDEGIFVGGCDEATSWITYNTASAIEITADNSGGTNAGDNGKLTLHFLIPSIYLRAGVQKIHQICLYSENASTKEEYCAYFLCQKIDSDGKLIDEWDAIEIPNEKTNLVLEWELAVGNK